MTNEQILNDPIKAAIYHSCAKMYDDLDAPATRTKIIDLLCMAYEAGEAMADAEAVFERTGSLAAAHRVILDAERAPIKDSFDGFMRESYSHILSTLDLPADALMIKVDPKTAEVTPIPNEDLFEGYLDVSKFSTREGRRRLLSAPKLKTDPIRGRFLVMDESGTFTKEDADSLSEHKSTARMRGFSTAPHAKHFGSFISDDAFEYPEDETETAEQIERHKSANESRLALWALADETEAHRSGPELTAVRDTIDGIEKYNDAQRTADGVRRTLLKAFSNAHLGEPYELPPTEKREFPVQSIAALMAAGTAKNIIRGALFPDHESEGN